MKLNRYQETFETWNKIAQIYQDKFMDLDLYNDTYDTFCELIPVKSSKILEIACDPDNNTKYLLNKNYKRAKGVKEIHTILIVKKNTNTAKN